MSYTPPIGRGNDSTNYIPHQNPNPYSRRRIGDPRLRRLSYAHIVAGRQPSDLPQPIEPTNIASTTPLPPRTAIVNLESSLRPRDSLSTSAPGMDDDMDASYSGHSSRRRTSDFVDTTTRYGMDTNSILLPMESYSTPFTPSYLRSSRHVQRVTTAWEKQMEALQEQESKNSTSMRHGTLSSSSSSVNLNKMPTASSNYRSVVQDIVERHPPPSFPDNDPLHPLPSRWSTTDKVPGLEVLANGAEVKLNGAPKSSDEGASLRSDYAMPRECGIYYYEITITSRMTNSSVGIGFSTKRASLTRPPGWESESWGYHGDDGCIYGGSTSGKTYANGTTFGPQDTVGCGMNFRTGTAFFTKNGVFLGHAFSGIKNDRLYPCVGMKKSGEHVRANFGTLPFVFDIDNLVIQERRSIAHDIRAADVSKLGGSGDSTDLIQQLIAQYLTHEGYVETSRAFAKDVRDRQLSFPGQSANTQPNIEPEDDIYAVHRQKIRRSILDGDIDKALKFTNAYFPHVLDQEQNRDIYFRLRCRKFIEMMRRYTELNAAASSPLTTITRKSGGSQDSNGHHDHQDHDLEDEPEDDEEDAEEEDEDDEDESLDGDHTNGAHNHHNHHHHRHRASASDDDDDATQMELDDQLARETTKTLPQDLHDHLPDLLTHTAYPGDDIDMDATSTAAARVPLKANDLLAAAVMYGQELTRDFGADKRPAVQNSLRDIFAVMAYPSVAGSPVEKLFDESGRTGIAEEVNGALLVSLNCPPSAALERLCAQTEALLDETAARQGGGAAALVNVRMDYLREG